MCGADLAPMCMGANTRAHTFALLFGSSMRRWFYAVTSRRVGSYYCIQRRNSTDCRDQATARHTLELYAHELVGAGAVLIILFALRSFASSSYCTGQLCQQQHRRGNTQQLST